MELRESIITSTIAHGVVVGGAMLGTFFEPPAPPEPILPVTEVSVITSSEFDAMFAENPEVIEDAPVAPVVLTPEVAPPLPQPDPIEEPQPQVAEPAPPAPIVETAPEIISEPSPDPSLPQLDEPPTPEEAPRVAPEPSPETTAEEAPIEQAVPEPVEPEPTQESEPEQTATAPPEATTEIVTEAETPSSAPPSSARPPSRPARPVRQEEPEVDLASAISSAVEEAQTDDAPSGPPMTAGETDVLRRAVQACWNVGALSSAALRTTVTIAFEMTQDGTPVAASLRLLKSSGGDSAAANQSYEAGRRAILRCGRTGYDLPLEKFNHWRNIELTFNPNEMRIR